MAEPTRHGGNGLSDSAMTIRTDSESYNAHEDPSPSPSPPSSSSSPIILYSPPTLWGLLRGAGINLVLPFINGLMLGLGELLAHEAAFRLGWGGTKVRTLQRLNATTLRSPWRPHTALLGPLVTSTPGVRFKSTASSITPVVSPEAVASAAPAAPPESLSVTSLDAVADLTAEDLASMPERIGYLKDLGLDYGWGPTALVEWVLEHIHIWTGTPWWLSITLTALAVRAVLFRPYMGAADTSARMAALKPVTQPITDKMQESQRAGDTAGVMRARAELKRIHARAGVKMYKAFVPMLQVFLGYGTFRLMRGMSTLPVPGLETGGLLWIRDLTISDPYFLLPLGTAAIFHLTMKRGGEMGNMLLSPIAQKFFVYGLPTFTFFIMLFWPGALQLSFFVSGVLSFLQASLFRSHSFRRWAGLTIPPAPPPKAKPEGGSGTSPYAGRLKLAPTYSPPSTIPSVAAASTPAPRATGRVKGIVDGAMTEIKGMTKEMKKTAEKYTGSSDTKPGKRSSTETQRAASYEAKRRKEEDRRRWDEAEAKRERWREKQEALERRRRQS
ncbi:MAG: Mitochondrial inner membrane protein oxa1 [Thelocarpon impressellum]|nr:MAG: Mitochondrial inner membrane protein oxa1 [Thelocarpon impressellum]